LKKGHPYRSGNVRDESDGPDILFNRNQDAALYLSHSVTQSLSHSVTQSLSHSVTQSLSHSVTQSLSHSVTQSLTDQLTYTLIHSKITHSQKCGTSVLTSIISRLCSSRSRLSDRYPSKVTTTCGAAHSLDSLDSLATRDDQYSEGFFSNIADSDTTDVSLYHTFT
jgi:hypothetical protein